VTYEFVVPANIPPSLNVVLRWHHRRKTQEREMWERTIAAILGRTRLKALRQVAGTGARMGVRVTIYNKRQYDKDNAYGGAKIVFDAIKNLGCIEDDREECADLRVEQVPSKEKCTVIQIGDYLALLKSLRP
jgi:hypothetical protein